MSTPTTSTRQRTAPIDLSKFALLSIAAAVATIALKAGAYLVSGSVGLLSDACESLVNLVAAIIAFIALKVSIKPGDKSHNFGHSKAEYFSAQAEGLMIFVAAVAIVWTAIDRLLHPQPLENVGLGLLISILASVLNGGVAWILLRAAKKHNSMTLKADGNHLLTDVWTSVGVFVGVGLVFVTKLMGLDWWWLDPVVALLVGLNIVWTGAKLIRESAAGLMDASLPRQENEALVALLNRYVVPGEVTIHGLRTRVAGRERFAEAHLLVPGDWTVTRSHDLCETIEDAVFEAFDGMPLMLHVEPIEDPRSWDDLPDAHIVVDEDAAAPTA